MLLSADGLQKGSRNGLPNFLDPCDLLASSQKLHPGQTKKYLSNEFDPKGSKQSL